MLSRLLLAGTVSCWIQLKKLRSKRPQQSPLLSVRQQQDVLLARWSANLLPMEWERPVVTSLDSSSLSEPTSQEETTEPSTSEGVTDTPVEVLISCMDCIQVIGLDGMGLRRMHQHQHNTGHRGFRIVSL